MPRWRRLVPRSPVDPLPAVLLALLGATLLSPRPAQAERPWRDHPTVSGPRVQTLPLYGTSADGVRLFVEARLGDGQPRLFMLDTGAAVTVISRKVALDLGLDSEISDQTLVGVAGRVRWEQAVLPEVELGRLSVGPVAVAVDVGGVPERVGQVPLAGILGVDVLRHFQVVVDYPARTLTLAAPDTLQTPEEAVPLRTTGSQQFIGAELTLGDPETGVRLTERVKLFVDTGSTDLMLFGPGAEGWEELATVGVEPIFGVGPIDELPTSNFLETTWRLPVVDLEVAGVHLDRAFDARWLQRPSEALGGGPGGDTIAAHGLLGHQCLEGHRVWFDYPAGAFAMEPQPEARTAFHDVHARALRLARRGKLDLAPVDRARVHLVRDEVDQALRVLERHLQRAPAEAEAVELLAIVLRAEGRPEEAIARLSVLSPRELAEVRELVAQVNALWLAGRQEEAAALAEAAVLEAPEAEQAWLALSDLRRAQGRLGEARRAMREANRLTENPDGHLLRRAWIAQEEGDHFAALTHLRRIMDLYPNSGLSWWMYAEQAVGTDEEEQLRRDLDRVRARLHPDQEPLDYLAAAMQLLGEEAEAEALARRGLARDCAGIEAEDSRKNCEAWYRALGEVELEQARLLIEEALQPDPHRTDYLDTLALVHEVREEHEAAGRASLEAAHLSPDDVYLLWQADRRGVFPAPVEDPGDGTTDGS